MKSDEIIQSYYFLAIVDLGGVNKAAAHLGITPSAISQSLSKLEDRLKTRLFDRKIRPFQPTLAGHKLAKNLREAFGNIQDSINETKNQDRTLQGGFRVTVSGVASEVVVMPHLSEFCALYPNLNVAIVVQECLTNLVRDHLDAGIRRADLLEPGMAQHVLTPQTYLMAAAAPAYLEQRSLPLQPQDLEEHRCICVRSNTDGSIAPWRFERDDVCIDFSTKENVVVDSVRAALEAALYGTGVVYLAQDYLKPYLENGRLISLLMDQGHSSNGWISRRSGFCLYWPTRRQIPAGVQIFGQFLSAQLGSDKGAVGFYPRH